MKLLSEASVQSRWVEREVNAAYEREARENRTVLFPIRIDDAVMNAAQPCAADIRRTRHIAISVNGRAGVDLLQRACRVWEMCRLILAPTTPSKLKGIGLPKAHFVAASSCP